MGIFTRYSTCQKVRTRDSLSKSFSVLDLKKGDTLDKSTLARAYYELDYPSSLFDRAISMAIRKGMLEQTKNPSSFVIRKLPGEESKYKVLVKRTDNHLGHYIAKPTSMRECRDLIKEKVSEYPRGTAFYIRYSRESLQGVRGYKEPNQEAYVSTKNGLKLVWKKTRDKRGMLEAIDEVQHPKKQ